MAARLLLGEHPIVKELIFCKLCNQFLEDPRVLPCQHTFCLKCLQQQFQISHASTRSRLSSIRCPQCYTTAAIPLRGLHQFPQDKKVEKIKELVDTSLMSSVLRRSRIDHLEGYKGAGGGKSRPSSWTGNVDVTEIEGDTGHLIHNSVPANLDQKGEKEIKLPETKEASTDTGDDKAIDHNFLVNNHHRENSVNLEECGIQTDLCDVTKYVGYEVVLTDTVDSQSARKRTNNARINQNGVPLSKRTCPSSNMKGLHHQVSDCDKGHNLINKEEGSSGISDTDFEGTNDVLFSVGNENSDKKHHALKKETTSSNNAKSNTDIGDDQVDSSMAENDMANEHVNGITMENHTNGTEDSDSEDCSPQPLPVYTTPLQLQWSHATQEYNMPTSIAMQSNGTTFVAEYGNCKIQMFESDGTYMLALDDVKPYALAMTSDDNLVVADRKDKTVKFYDTNGSLIYAWEKESFFWISGVSVTSQGNLVIFARLVCLVPRERG